MNTPAEPTPPSKGQFLVYRTDDGQLKIDVRLEGETAWLTQAHMAELFQTTIPNVSMHLRNVYAEGELQAAATVKEFLIVRPEGNRQVSRTVEHYNLDAIISVGYRVKSAIATRFRIWATQKRPNPSHKDSLIVRQKNLARGLEQTIAGSLPLPLGEDGGEGAQRVAEILEA